MRTGRTQQHINFSHATGGFLAVDASLHYAESRSGAVVVVVVAADAARALYFETITERTAARGVSVLVSVSICLRNAEAQHSGRRGAKRTERPASAHATHQLGGELRFADENLMCGVSVCVWEYV